MNAKQFTQVFDPDKAVRSRVAAFNACAKAIAEKTIFGVVPRCRHSPRPPDR